MIPNNDIDGPIIINNKGMIEAFNKTAESIFGYLEAEVIGKALSLLIADGHKIEHDNYLYNYLTSGKTKVIDTICTVDGLKKDGQTFPMELTLSEILIGNERKSMVHLSITSDSKPPIIHKIEQQKTISEATSQVLSSFINSSNQQTVFNDILNNILSTTQSKFGFISEIFLEHDHSPYLKTRAITDISWDEKSRQRYNTHQESGLDFHNMNTLFGTVILSQQQLISNHPEVDLRRKGLPAGHPPLTAFLGVPLTIAGKIIGMIGIANRPGGYSQKTVDSLATHLQSCTSAMAAYHAHQRQLHSADALAESNATIRLLLDSTTEAIVTLDSDGICTLANPVCCCLLGYRDHELIGHDFHSLAHHSQKDNTHLPHSECRIQQVLKKKLTVHADNERFWRKDGSSFPIEYRTHPIIKQGVTVGALVSFTDISERLQADKKLWNIAHFDPLTGLANRALFHDRMEQTLAQARRNKTGICLFFLNLDNFKTINDIAGHNNGDKVLTVVAGHLQQCVREVDTVAHLDADEFTIILSGITDKEQAIIVAYKIITTLNESIQIKQKTFNIGASIGIAVFPEDGIDVESLVKSADQAMHAAKESGKNRCVFFQDMKQQALKAT
ncbi:MAG: diguanylate cyclase [Mariprofundus sp.]|nr:diguanylate cyclase [Mariprofundus sp.]